MRRARRLEAYYVATCNGDREGCAWQWHGGGYLPETRRVATRHAEVLGHEVVITNTNDGLVLDGRPRR